MNKLQWKNFFENKTEHCRVLVVGDVMIDKYYHGDVSKFASDAPVPVAKIIKRRAALGAAANVANNLALMGCKTYLAGFVGDLISRSSQNRNDYQVEATLGLKGER